MPFTYNPTRCRISQASKTFFKDVGIDTFASLGANMIGERYSKGDLNVVSHKLAHAFLGGAIGGMVEGEKGILPGAVDGLLSETIMEMMAPKEPTKPKGGFTSKEEADLFEANVTIYHDQLQKVESITRILIASGFLFTGHDPMLGDRIAQNSIEHNFFGGVEERLASLFKKDRKEDEAFWQEQDEKVVECVTEHPDDILDGTQGLLTLASLYPPALPIAQMLQRVITGVRGVYKVGRFVEGEVAPTLKVVEGETVSTKIVVEDAPVVAKKPISEMTDLEFTQSLANRAERIVDGKGPVVGTKKHDYAKRLGERYQEMTGERPDVVFEKRYIAEGPWKKGDPLKGSVKPDVYNKSTGEVFDYKFGDAKLGQRQISKLQETLPKTDLGKSVTVTEIKPTGGFKP